MSLQILKRLIALIGLFELLSASQYIEERSVALDMKRFKAAMHPVNFCTSFIFFRDNMLRRAFIFSGLTDHESDEFSLGYPKHALFGVELHPALAQDVEHFTEVANMIIGSLTLDEYIVDVYLHRSTDFPSEHLFEDPLIGRPSIFQAKWHFLVAVQPSVCDESSALLVGRVHGDSVITRVRIHKVEKLVPSRSVDQLIDAR